MKIHIDTGDNKLIALNLYGIPLAHIKLLDEQIDKLLNMGIIRPLAHIKWLDEQIDILLKAGIIRHSNSPWSLPVVLVHKKEDGLGLCIDFRKLNPVTTQYKFHMPFIRNFALSREM